MSRCFETEMDDNRSAGVMEKSEITIENEDETDQAKVCYHLCALCSSVHFLAKFVIFCFLCSIIWKAMKSTI